MLLRQLQRMVTLIMDNERLYEYASKVDRHDEDIKELKAEIKELKEKTSLLTELSLSIKALAENLKDVKQTVTDIKEDQEAIKTEVTELRSKPDVTKARILDKIVIGVAGALGGAILAHLLTVLFPNLV